MEIVRIEETQYRVVSYSSILDNMVMMIWHENSIHKNVTQSVENGEAVCG